MNLLFDTYALIWWLGGNEKLSAAVREAIGDMENNVAVSAASAIEVSKNSG